MPKWKPLQRAGVGSEHPDVVRKAMELYQVSETEARQILDRQVEQCEYWVNDIYQVEVRRSREHSACQINIRRRDGKAIFRDWRHFQRIKNEVVGPECEAVELYPAESRLVDTSNKYHLWAYTDGRRFPLGFPERDVSYDTSSKHPGLRQRGWEE